MPQGKPAGVPCVQLEADGRCRLFGHPSRPAVCSGLQPAADMCGSSRAHAMQWLAQLEAATTPAEPRCITPNLADSAVSDSRSIAADRV
jgi:hypothetical protein